MKFKIINENCSKICPCFSENNFICWNKLQIYLIKVLIQGIWSGSINLKNIESIVWTGSFIVGGKLRLAVE